MRRLIVAITTVAFACCASSAFADDKLTDAEAREILKNSAEAIRKLDGISYQATYAGTEWVEPLVPKIDGMVVVGKRSQFDITEFFCQVKIRPNDSEKTLEFTAGSDGESFFLIDPLTKKAHFDIDPAVLGSNGRDIQRAVFSELGASQPFENALESGTVRSEGTEVLDGIDCHKIQVVTEQPPEVVLYICQKDLLPRRVVRVYKNKDDQPGTTDLKFANVKPNPRDPKDPFRLHVPKGYEKTDDFAP